MAAVRMADQIVFVGCANGGRLAAVAAPSGISGRAVVVAPDDASLARARTGAEQTGVLVELVASPLNDLPLDTNAFDLAVIDDTGGLLGSSRVEARVGIMREAFRVLKPGGRVLVLGAGRRGGLGALLSRAATGPSIDPIPLLDAEGFRASRRLAEREGLVFVEAMKPRQ